MGDIKGAMKIKNIILTKLITQVRYCSICSNILDIILVR